MLNGSRVCLYLHGHKAGRGRRCRLGLQSGDTTSPLVIRRLRAQQIT